MKNLLFKNKTVKIFKGKKPKVNTKEFVKNSTEKLIALKTVNIEWKMISGERLRLIEIAGTEKT